MKQNGHAPRVVVTGIGAITPLGHTWPETWAALKVGTSAGRRITSNASVLADGAVGFGGVAFLGFSRLIPRAASRRLTNRRTGPYDPAYPRVVSS